MGSRFRHSTGPKINFFAFQDIITATSGIVILVVLMLAADLGRSVSGTAESHPELKKQLGELLAEQARLEVDLAQLREMIALARALPDTGKLAAEAAQLRERLESARQRAATIQAGESAQDSAIRQQDALLGLADLRSTLDKLKQETAAITEKNLAASAKMQSLEEQVRSAQAKLLKFKARAGQMWLAPDKDNSTKEPILVQVSHAGVVVERFDQPAERAEFRNDSELAGFRERLARFNQANQYFVFLIRPSGIDLFKKAADLVRTGGFELGFDALEENQLVHFATPKASDWDNPAPTNAPAVKTTAPPETGGPAPAKPPLKPKEAPQPESWWRRLWKTPGR